MERRKFFKAKPVWFWIRTLLQENSGEQNLLTGNDSSPFCLHHFLIVGLTNCLPFPPPFGCADLVHTREVLTQRESDFVLMCLFCSSLYLWIVALSFAILASPENSRIFGMEHLSARNMIIKSFMTSGAISIITL